jgi:hypothetical protein
MKQLRSTPDNLNFFATYASMAVALRRSGWLAQVVSALTEIGGIYAAAYASLLPVVPQAALYGAATIAILGTAIIEIGLRVLAPHSVDAVLYKRYKGLHLAMTIAIWIMTVMLVSTSGVLSFRNSRTIVDQFTPEAEQWSTQSADSLLQKRTSQQRRTWQSDSASIVQRYAVQIQAQTTAYDNKRKAAKRKLSNIYNQERRTGKSYATAKDRVRQQLVDIEAEKASSIASLQTQQAQSLEEANTRFQDATDQYYQRYQTTIDSISQANQGAIAQRENTVQQYGTGLGWFTVVALFVFVVSVILDRIHSKGSGIRETVELNQYDIAPNTLTEAWSALRERIQYSVRYRVKAFADKTPPAPLPSSPNELYDPTQLTNITINVKLDPESNTEERVIYVQPKRRQIGFQSAPPANPATSPIAQSNKQCLNTENNNLTKREPTDSNKTPTEHEAGEGQSPNTNASCAVKGTPAPHEELSMPDLLQRLKMYKKRVGKHEQKKRTAEQAGKPVPKRTLNAIENNRNWVCHYQSRINKAKNEQL